MGKARKRFWLGRDPGGSLPAKVGGRTPAGSRRDQTVPGSVKTLRYDASLWWTCWYLVLSMSSKGAGEGNRKMSERPSRQYLCGVAAAVAGEKKS